MQSKILDNMTNRQDLINRVENIVKSIIQQTMDGQLPIINNVSSSSIDVLIDNDDEDDDDLENDEMNLEDKEEDDEEEDEDEELIDDPDIMPNDNHKNIVVNFSGKCGEFQLPLMMIILAKAHKLITSNAYQTKRSLYYELKSEGLVDEQRIVDHYINKTASLLKCTTWNLGFIGTAKGLMSGNIKLSLENDRTIDCDALGGVLIPQANSNIIKIESSISFIIVVEKDAVFQKLLLEECPKKFNCLVVTGKGYPDVATRIFLKLIIEKLNVPAYIMVDADPHGIEIMCVYKYGSASLEWEKSSLISSKIQWIGIAPSEIWRLNVKSHPLSNCDEKKLESLEKKTYLSDEIKNELNILRQGKVDIEAVSKISTNFLTE
ncbi:meiotic recombination protein SPO11, partial [Aphidius gifuensis]|uniref:meiotic recombination protein SPO11 n=1 Tax=Aphidius gifuensis TaxID=684658 RepID=UPI001CDC7310